MDASLDSPATDSPESAVPNPDRFQMGNQILRVLRERILKWRYPPGKHLAEHALCAEFSASRVPVREALNGLAEQGLVEKRPKQGCFVKQPDVEDIQHLYDMRLALELFVVERLARGTIAPELLARERAYWEPLLDIRANDPVDGGELARSDEQFHLGLSHALGNPYLIQSLTDIYERVNFVRATVITTPHRVQTTAGEHLKILAAIEAKDVNAARRSLRQNISHSRNKVEIAIARALTDAMKRGG